MTPSNKEILVVEDSRMFAHTITAAIHSELDCTTQHAASFEEARQAFHHKGNSFFAAVLDLVLPDAPHGEVVDYVLEKNIPTIVLTSAFSDAVREEFTSRDIVDYIIKEGPHSLAQLIQTLRRLEANRSIKILVVDDAKLSRRTIKSLLARHRFTIIEASNGREALKRLDDHPDTRVVITDYHMPEMDGFELITRIRQIHTMDKMAILGVSGSGGSTMSAKFLKKGANDFIVKPFSNEEFYLRINQNVQMLEYIDAIHTAAIRDHLTGLYNRRYFFDIGAKLFGNAKRKSFELAVAMIDIDHFKRINDRFGHQTGDDVLRHISAILANHFRSSDIVARLGGEEFCIMTPNMSPAHSFRIFDALRQTVQSTPLSTEAGRVDATISIGLTAMLSDSLEETLNQADQLLYKAKRSGRNQVMAD